MISVLIVSTSKFILIYFRSSHPKLLPPVHLAISSDSTVEQDLTPLDTPTFLKYFFHRHPGRQSPASLPASQSLPIFVSLAGFASSFLTVPTRKCRVCFSDCSSSYPHSQGDLTKPSVFTFYLQAGDSNFYGEVQTSAYNCLLISADASLLT